MTSLLTRMWNDDRGQDMAEYAIVLGIIAAAGVGLAAAFSTAISSVWTSVEAAL